ncbi:hypothetical protein ACFYNY_33320 [Streptomyces sp. NPDC006530]|uniref:hypothetical protein n=1 Tax=Streptomyces sp. NPDC006530 TaxID=3364750 RepID=UPI00367D8F4C
MALRFRAETTSGTPITHQGRRRALVVCLAGGFITLLDASIVNVVLPASAPPSASRR